MYKLMVYDKNKSYMLVGESANPDDYTTIPVGASVFVLDTLEVFHKQSPDDTIQVDVEEDISPDNPSDEPAAATSVLGEAIIGEMKIGE